MTKESYFWLLLSSTLYNVDLVLYTLQCSIVARYTRNRNLWNLPGLYVVVVLLVVVVVAVFSVVAVVVVAVVVCVVCRARGTLVVFCVVFLWCFRFPFSVSPQTARAWGVFSV